ncbi:MAG: efflux RND transporter permease subunit, partial [Phycisphaerales bacterium]|nr:efflux RND transporter permease subunit [Phycisphaerales bacterium]
VESMWIISPSGALVPLTEIADLTDASSYATIKRVDRRRTTTVTASTSTSVNPEDIVGAIDFDALRARYPRVEIALGGRQEQQADAFGSLPLGFGTALILIYVILAWLFGSYTQPLAVMLAIPFGLVGVIWGHWVMDYDMTFLSVIGFVALSGIVVNDSLILVEFFNMQRSAGVPLHEALIEAGRRRLRPIFLTTVTTVLGLLPLMLEESFQAKFLIPMAISISFGLMSATLLILLVLPCMIVVIDDIKRVAHLGWHGRPREDAAGAPAASA